MTQAICIARHSSWELRSQSLKVYQISKRTVCAISPSGSLNCFTSSTIALEHFHPYLL